MYPPVPAPTEKEVASVLWRFRGAVNSHCGWKDQQKAEDFSKVPDIRAATWRVTESGWPGCGGRTFQMNERVKWNLGKDFKNLKDTSAVTAQRVTQELGVVTEGSGSHCVEPWVMPVICILSHEQQNFTDVLQQGERAFDYTGKQSLCKHISPFPDGGILCGCRLEIFWWRKPEDSALGKTGPVNRDQDNTFQSLKNILNYGKWYRFYIKGSGIFSPCFIYFLRTKYVASHANRTKIKHYKDLHIKCKILINNNMKNW